MATLDTYKVVHDFFGVNDDNGEAADLNPLAVRDISPAGAPTIAFVDGSVRGELSMQMAADSEIQNLCLYQNDVLQYDIDTLTQVKFRVKMNQATPDSTTQFTFGLTGDRNDAIDSIAQAIIFRLIGADTSVYAEYDDGTNTEDDLDTGEVLVAAYKDFLINFAEGTSDIRLFIDGQPVLTGTTFNMSAYTGKLQLFMQIQKTADTNTDGFTVDYVEIRGRDSSV
jgi:hypothetical protein